MEMPVDKASELYTLMDKIKAIKMYPFLKFFRKWGKLSVLDFARRFKNPYFREVFPLAFGGDMPDMPLFFLLMTLGWLNSKEAGYPIGGALPFAGSIERRYLDLGGEICCKSRVDRILVDKNRAVGIRLADGTEHKGDTVISAADGHTTIFKMLEGRFINDEIRANYDNPRLYAPLIYVGMGVARSFDDVPPSVGGITFPLEKPVSIAGKERKVLSVMAFPSCLWWLPLSSHRSISCANLLSLMRFIQYNRRRSRNSRKPQLRRNFYEASHGFCLVWSFPCRLSSRFAFCMRAKTTVVRRLEVY
jgi:hypothetical protein